MIKPCLPKGGLHTNIGLEVGQLNQEVIEPIMKLMLPFPTMKLILPSRHCGCRKRRVPDKDVLRPSDPRKTSTTAEAAATTEEISETLDAQSPVRGGKGKNGKHVHGRFKSKVEHLQHL